MPKVCTNRSVYTSQIQRKVHQLSKEVNVSLPLLNTQPSNINQQLFIFQEQHSSQVVYKSSQSSSSDLSVSCIHLCGFLSLKIQQTAKY